MSTPKSETPRSETPRSETPRSETPRSETPRSESPRAEALIKALKPVAQEKVQVAQEKARVLAEKAKKSICLCPQPVSSGRYIYSVFHMIMSLIAIYLSFRCNKGFDTMSFVLALCCPHIYIIYILATKGTCGIIQNEPTFKF